MTASGQAGQLVLHDVTKRFGGVEAVSHVSFAVREGEVLGLIGPNGAGKSTLLSLVSGGQRPNEGQITFRGQRLDRLPAHAIARSGVGRAHQIPRPFARMTIRDNVRVAAHSTSGRGLLERDTVVRGALELCGLAERADRLAGSLTLLDLKRLEIARALALEPQLLLLDEVAAGLVGREVDEVIALVRRVQQRGTTIIMVEHVQTLIQSLAERVIVLDWGRKIAEGTPAEVSRDPNVMAVYFGSQAQVESGVGPARSGGESPETILRAEGITVDYGKLRALRAVDVEVRRGEVVAVLGANGAGKSTLARAVAGLVRSRFGLRLMAVRDDEDAAAELGVNGFTVKLTALTISAFFTGLGGGLVAMQKISLEPYSAFSVTWATSMIVMSVVGGLSTLAGPIVGAVVIFGLQQLLLDFLTLSSLVVGVLLIVILLIAPNGLIGAANALFQRKGGEMHDHASENRRPIPAGSAR